MAPYRTSQPRTRARVFRGSWWALAKLGALGSIVLSILGYLTYSVAEEALPTVVTAGFLLVAAIVIFTWEWLLLLRFRVTVDDESMTIDDPVGRVQLRWDELAEVHKLRDGRGRSYWLRAADGRSGMIISKLRGFRELERHLLRQLERRGWVGLEQGPEGVYRAPLRPPSVPGAAPRARAEEPEAEETVDASDGSTHTRRRERHL